MYIVIEGADGSGKSAISKALVERLNAKEVDTRLVIDPSDQYSTADYRTLLKTNVLSKKEQLLIFYANRVGLSNAIHNFEENGIHVVSDRNHTSSMIYQEGLFDGGNLMKALDAYVDYPIPDYLFIIHRDGESKVPDDSIESNVDNKAIRHGYYGIKPALEAYYSKVECPKIISLCNESTIESIVSYIIETIKL